MFSAHRRSNDPLSKEAKEYFDENGFIVLTGMLDPAEVKETRQLVLDLAEHEAKLKSAHFYGPNLQRVWNLLNKDTKFHDLITSPHLLAWMEHLFDRPTPHKKYFLSSFQANILLPGAPAQKLHIDTPIPEPLPPWIIKANSIWLLDDFTETNGSTEVIPGSHKRPRKPRPDDPADAAGMIKVIAPAGSIIITHGALWHRSGQNNSPKPRIVLLGSFAASYAREIASEEDIVRCLNPQMLDAMDEDLKILIGHQHGMKPGGMTNPNAT